MFVVPTTHVNTKRKIDALKRGFTIKRLQTRLKTVYDASKHVFNMKRVETQLEKILKRIWTHFLYITPLNAIWKNINCVSTRFILKSRLYAINKNSAERVQTRCNMKRVSEKIWNASERVFVKNRVYMWVIASYSFKMCSTSELDQVKLGKKICFIKSLYAIDASII